MMMYHTTWLLSAACALLIFNQNQVYCPNVTVSSSSEQVTFCNGMRCPSGSSCTVSTNVISGNKTSVTICSIISGDIVRREIITVANGEMCIKNTTIMGEKVTVEESCRNMSKAETDYMEQKQEAIEVFMEERSKLNEKQWHEMERGIKNISEALEMQAQRLEQAAEERAEQLKARLAKMEKKLKAKFGYTEHLRH